MTMDKMSAVFPAQEAPKANEIRKAESITNKTEVKKTQNEGLEPDFQKVLEKTARKDESNQEQKPAEVKSINEKIVQLEKTISALSVKEEFKPVLTELLTMLNNIKQMLSALKETNTTVSLKTEDVSIDVVSFISALLDDIQAKLQNPTNHNEIAKTIDIIQTKLAVIQEALPIKTDIAQNHSQTTSIVVTQNPKHEETEKLEQKTERVKIIDNRTEPKIMENTDTPKEDRIVKVLRENKIPLATKEVKIDSPIDKPVGLKAMTMEISEKNQNAAMETLPMQNKFEQSPSVFAKQYANFSSTVSKANLEALMQNIAGRAFVTLNNGKSEIKMNLIPPELGRMSMKLTLEDGIVMGKIVVATPEAKMLFDQNLGELQRLMQQGGMQMGNLDVSLGNPEQGKDNLSQSEASATTNSMAMDYDDNNGEVVMQNHLFESSINFVA